MKLSLRERLFVQHYDGNGQAAAEKAGYSKKGARRQAARLLKLPRVVQAVAAREAKGERIAVLNRERRQEWWSRIMQDGMEEMGFRLRASELLARSCGDFLDRVHLEGSATLKLPEGLDLETLEALAKGESPLGVPNVGADSN